MSPPEPAAIVWAPLTRRCHGLRSINDAMQQCHSTCRLDFTNRQSNAIHSCDTEDGGVRDAVTHVPDYGHREVAWWNLDSDSVLTSANEAATMTDLVSHHDGELVGAVQIVHDQDPARGYVLEFSGSSDHPGFVEIEPSPSWNLNESVPAKSLF